MIKALFDVLFPPEQAFLEKVCENIVHDLGMKDAVIQVVGLERKEKAEPELIFAMKRPEDGDLPEGILGMPRISALVERVGGGAAIYVDVFVLDKTAAQKYVSLAKGLASAIALFRGTKDSFAISILSHGITAIENVSETQIIVSAISRWMEDDEEYRFWKKNSAPYLGWFFEEPNFGSMGRDMITAVCKVIKKCAEEQGDMGNYKLMVAPYGELTKEAFGAIPECTWFETKVVGMLNTQKQIYFSSGERAEMKFELTEMNERNETVNHLMDFTVTLETGHQKDINTWPYRGEIAKSILEFLNVWWLVRRQKACEFKVTESRSSF